MAMPIKTHFVGEYSQDGGQWLPIKEDMNLSSYDGELVLRGRMDVELPEETWMKSRFNHIGMSVSVNGEIVFESSSEAFPELCGNSWIGWLIPALEPEDVLKIHLYNPHNFGNKDAYKYISGFYLHGQ